MSAEVDSLPDMLARLRLGTMRDKLDGSLDEAARGDLSLRETLTLLCRAEVSHREERRIQMSMSLAKFPHQRTLDASQTALETQYLRARTNNTPKLDSSYAWTAVTNAMSAIASALTRRRSVRASHPFPKTGNAGSTR